jgi:hypothetical protein
VKRAWIIPVVFLAVILSVSAYIPSRYFTDGVLTYWTKTDTSIVVNFDSLAYRNSQLQRLLDSIGGGASRDSIRRDGRIYTITAHLSTSLNTDTSSTRYFPNFGSDPLGAPNGRAIQMLAHRTLIPYSIAISHRYTDATFIRRARDTTHIFTTLDSIPVQNGLWIYYDPAFGGTAARYAQIIQLAKSSPHQIVTSKLSSEVVQVPLVLHGGQVGLLPDHELEVTVTLIEKVPGLKYW